LPLVGGGFTACWARSGAGFGADGLGWGCLGMDSLDRMTCVQVLHRKWGLGDWPVPR